MVYQGSQKRSCQQEFFMSVKCSNKVAHGQHLRKASALSFCTILKNKLWNYRVSEGYLTYIVSLSATLSETIDFNPKRSCIDDFTLPYTAYKHHKLLLISIGLLQLYKGFQMN